jgi:hypothetical protein
MSTSINATESSTGSPAAAAATNLSLPPKPAASLGLGSGNSSLSSSGDAITAKTTWTARGTSFLSNLARIPTSFVWGKITGFVSWVLDKIYGPGRIPAQTIELEVKGWIWGSSIQKVSLDTAFEKKLITPAQALEKGYCNKEYLTSRGWNIIEFDYKGWTGTSHMKIKLRSALKQGYITIEEAIDQKFITKAQAIEGGFLKADKPVKTNK